MSEFFNHLGRADALGSQYESAVPFPHIVIDNFFRDSVLDAVPEEVALIPQGRWKRSDHENQQKKRWMSETELMPSKVKRALKALNSAAMVAFLEQLTGIEDIRTDPSFLGGGIHCTETGGRLGIHADFNLHPATGFHRRINVLVYLNRTWDENWGGELLSVAQ